MNRIAVRSSIPWWTNDLIYDDAILLAEIVNFSTKFGGDTKCDGLYCLDDTVGHYLVYQKCTPIGPDEWKLAIRSYIYCYHFAPDNIKRDKSLSKFVLEIEPKMFEFIPEEHKNDPELIAMASIEMLESMVSHHSVNL